MARQCVGEGLQHSGKPHVLSVILPRTFPCFEHGSYVGISSFFSCVPVMLHVVRSRTYAQVNPSSLDPLGSFASPFHVKRGGTTSGEIWARLRWYNRQHRSTTGHVAKCELINAARLQIEPHRSPCGLLA
jgi:hypothetical protein